MNLFDVYSVSDIEIVKALGSDLWDKNGKHYLDLYGGHAVISIGHTHPHYVSSLTEQLQKIGFYSNSIVIDQQKQLATKLGLLSGYTHYQLFLCNSGAEANENAFKLASFHNGRKKIIAFNKAFHGRTSLAVASTDNLAIVAPVNENNNTTFLPLNDSNAFDQAVNDEVCCVIIEGIQGVAGIQIPEPEFLQHVAQKCKTLGIVLILDEVQSGYGRTGKFFAHQHAGIQPDIITVAKGMGNGFPIAGVLIAPHIQPKKEMLGTTFGGNYLACTAGLAVLEVIEKENLMENAQKMGEYLMEQLQNIPNIKEIRGMGLMVAIELYEPCAAVRKRLLDEFGIFTGTASNKNTLRILPSLAVTKKELDELLQALKIILK
ncbi:aspartate aminotransferase family protein [Flavobacterium columnare]|uniref:Aminotransferase class III-fold pyridoxal phosphate-dependent enzyme n=1 Tax=Flavobacterium columnare TaxID=996 RepID=A0AAI8CJM8_9FLAO|nr:aminotransferase class III-fold pyridoxal phosphate-dependent enzyme [Flavobacterium columnare]AMO21479.1 aminotransferase class III-fold pyridoxal phosphate-dependent enzyme [Flavobacterium columnare]AUX19494.1 acetylornithine aminotransferase [Flavobacterium columnare]QOG58557.1 aminotransferase class III-fold pyridoxal phosphate-dependent enzyme [Flavobacterium columnare]QOG61279.1 aminotransferase class III-fold pyridoxal phosphate-dependent enzyme [Flavobacterium columnare]QOG64002.1 a